MIMDFGWSNYIHIKLVADVPAMWLYNTYTAICHYKFLGKGCNVTQTQYCYETLFRFDYGFQVE